MDQAEYQVIRERLQAWDKFPAHAEADFECLVNEVVAGLEEGFGSFDLAAVIQNEFVNHFGETGPDEDVMQIADELSLWWMNRTTRQGEQ